MSEFKLTEKNTKKIDEFVKGLSESQIGEPFGGFRNFDQCLLSQGGDTPTNRRKCGALKQQFEQINHEFANQWSFEAITELTKETISESFEWLDTEKIDKLKEIARNKGGKLYKVIALHPIVTDRDNDGHGAREWTLDETKRMARTLAAKALNLNHEIQIKQGENIVVDAEEHQGKLEAFIYLEDLEIQNAIANHWIEKVSVQGKPRKVKEGCLDKNCNTKAERPEGTILNGLALIVSKPFKYDGKMVEAERPGDIRSSIEVFEKISKSNDSIKSKTGQQGSIMSETNEALDTALKGIDQMQDVSDEFKQQLAAKARELYANQDKPPAGESTNPPATVPPATPTTPPATPPNTQTPPNPDDEKFASKEQVTKLESLIGEVSKKFDSFAETTLNKVLDEKLKGVTEQLQKKPEGQTGTNSNLSNEKVLENMDAATLGQMLHNKLSESELADVVKVAMPDSKGGVN